MHDRYFIDQLRALVDLGSSYWYVAGTPTDQQQLPMK